MKSESQHISIGEVIVFTGIAIAGILGYYLHLIGIWWICSIALSIVLAINMAAGQLKTSHILSFLAASLAAGFVMSHKEPAGILLGVCFYYASVPIFSTIVRFLSEFIICELVAIAGTILFLVADSAIAMPLGAYCVVSFIVSAITNKLPLFSYVVLVVAIIMGTLLNRYLSPDIAGAMNAVRILLFGSCIFYPFSALSVVLNSLFGKHNPF